MTTQTALRLKSDMGIALYTAQQCQKLDRHCIDDLGFSGYALMQQAAQAAFAVMLSEWPNVQELIMLCGKGNNGGDGFEMASIAQEHGIDVQLVFDGPIYRLEGEAKQAAEAAITSGLSVISSAQINWYKPNCVIVDALLGVGMTGAPSEDVAELITQVNDSPLPVLSLDVPSGVNATTGYVAEVAVIADITVTMLLNKQGLFTGDAPDYVGQVRMANLGIPKTVRSHLQTSSRLLNWHSIQQGPFFHPRKVTAHKGDFGHVLIIGGDSGMAGAVSLSASAALRSGAGRVSVATRPEHVSAIVARQPEVMAHGIESGQQLLPLLAKADVIAIGPGLGQSSWGQQMLQQVMQTQLPVVLDADALNLLAQGNIKHNLSQRVSVMTPHAGEAARLLGVDIPTIAQDRFAALRLLSERYSSYVVLKGAGSIMGDHKGINVCTDGNPGMASGGMGDVLTGIAASFMAQHLDALPKHCHQVISGAVCLHSAAADEGSKQGQSSLLASDLLVELRQLLN
ncbi:NAD(P)H-hydrate dehydratase [Pseudomonas sp. HK3]